MIVAVDTEVSGLDIRHGARPYLVTTCIQDDTPKFWQWQVDPTTRLPQIPSTDIKQIKQLIADADELVLHNASFDIRVLDSIGVINWPWPNTRDTLIAGHLLATNRPHNLTDMAIEYLGIDIEPLEKDAQYHVTEARKFAKKYRPDWRLAKHGLAEMPSIKKSAKNNEDKPWKNDMWICRALAIDLKLEPDHPWWMVIQDYANGDSEVTSLLWPVLQEQIKQRDLWEIFLTRMQVVQAAYRMGTHGVTAIVSNTQEIIGQFQRTSEQCHSKCVNLSNGVLTKLPVNGRSKQLEQVVFDHFGLSSPKETKKGNPSMDKDVIDQWLNQSNPDSDIYQFIRHLQFYRKRQTALGYIDSYQRFWLPTSQDNIKILYPGYNTTGTKLLRGSMSSPNTQQVAKQNLAEMGSLERGKNVRHMLGPAPDREWFSMDGMNLELRIPAFEADETDLVYVFNHPNDAPYYGSYHLVVCDVLHPVEFKKHGKEFKTVYEDTLYQWVKNGNFAIQYGAQQKKADATYRVSGAYGKISKRFPKITQLANRLKEHANQYGFVETIPDRTVNPRRGYPLICTLSETGGVVPTNPLSYHVQGTAGWWINKAMIRCDNQLLQWRQQGWDGRMIMQVHDELVFDLPRGTGSKPWLTNLPRINKLKWLMVQGGVDIGVPTPVSVEYHPDNWSVGITV